ncbi:hypothetical protein A8D94_08770 [Burkholderia cenocepacia]|nr:hypothetical protein A8D94_08770 [Burkholderia cenocepacia]
MSTIDPVLPPLPPVRAEYTRPLDPLPDAERAAPAPRVRRRAAGRADACIRRARAAAAAGPDRSYS